MAGHVSQRLLHDAKEVGFNFSRETAFDPVVLKGHRQAILPLDPVEEPKQGGQQAQIIQHRRPQVQRHAPHAICQLINQMLRLG